MATADAGATADAVLPQAFARVGRLLLPLLAVTADGTTADEQAPALAAVVALLLEATADLGAAVAALFS